MRCVLPMLVPLAFIVGTTIVVADDAANKDKVTESNANHAVANVTGNLVCTHCDLSVGDECCAGLIAGETIFFLGGKANKELFDLRQTGLTRRVNGALSVNKYGYLQLDGTSDKQPPKQRTAEVVVTGRVIEDDTKLAVDNGKQTIYLRGDAADPLRGSVGKWAKVKGELNLDRKLQIRLTAETAKIVVAPAKSSAEQSER